MSQTRSTTVVISFICDEYATSATFRRKTVDCSLMQPSKKGSSHSFYFMSKTSALLHCCFIFYRRSPFAASDRESLPRYYFPSSQPFRRLRLRVASAALFSIVAALRDFVRRRNLSPPSAANRFRDFILRRRSLSACGDSLVDAAFRRLLASTTSCSIVTAFRRLFTTSSAVAALHRLRPQVASATLSSVVAAFRRPLPSTQPFVDSFRRRSPSSTRTCDSFRSCRWSSFPFLFLERRFHVYVSEGVTDGRMDGRN